VEYPALEAWRDRVAEEAEKVAASVELRLAGRALELLSGGDPRFRFLDPRRARAIGLEDAQAWLDETICLAPLEVGVAGPVAPNRTLGLAARYLGGLTERPDRDPSLDRLRRLPSSLMATSDTVRVATEIPRAAVLTGWRASPWRASRERRILRVAEYLVERRLEVEMREQRGLTYAAQCSFNPSRAYPRASLFAIAFFVAPARVGEASDATETLVARLCARGPTEAEVEAARRHLAQSLYRARRQPVYWSRLLAELDYRGTTIQRLSEVGKELRAIRSASVVRVLRRELIDGRRVRVTCLPIA
jgi:zinc protease